MPKQTHSRKRAASEEYDSDGGFVEDVPRSKKSKSNNKAPLSFEMKKDDENNEYWDISSTRRLVLSDFKGNNMVSIREYYTDSAGKLRPGKKGISLNLDQFNAVIQLLPQVESGLKSKGIKVARPQYNQVSSTKATLDDDEPDETGEGSAEEEGEAAKVHKSAKSKLDKFKHKANHEATSDEDDD